MTNSILTRFVAVSLLLISWPTQSPAKEYVLTVGSEQLRFVPQGEKGYVVKQPKRTAEITALAGTLFLEEGQVRPIGGLDRHGIWIVQNDGPASRNDAVMAELIQRGAAEYVAPLFSSNGETVAIIPEIVVRVKPGIVMEDVQILCESAGCTIKKPMEFTTQEYLLEVLGPDAEAVFAAVEELGQAPEVEWACPNTAARLRLAGGNISAGDRLYAQDPAQGTFTGSATSSVFSNDPYFPMQWHLHNTGQSVTGQYRGTPGADIRAPEAWEITTGDPNIVIAVVDTGVDTRHPDLINNLVPGYDFYNNDDQPDPATDQPGCAHGTACAGIIAAQGNNGIGVAGVTWSCKIMPIRSFFADGQKADTTEADYAEAFRWAAAHGADIFSNSWGWSANPPVIMHSAIVDITKAGGIGRGGKGCVVLHSIGNSGVYFTNFYPQSYPEVIAVGATNHNDQRTSYSSYGPSLDVMAPSGSGLTLEYARQSTDLLWTTDIVGPAGQSEYHPELMLDYTGMSGTSGSTPVAAGIAALILSIEPNLTNDEARHFLERSAKDLGAPGRDDYYGWGRVDARAALDMVLAKRADLNNDWRVDLKDFALLAQFWKTSESSADIAPAKKRDGTVDIKDIVVMAEYWLRQIPEIGAVGR